MTYPNKSEDGSALVVVISFTLISTAFSAALLTTSTSHGIVARRQSDLEKALFVAEAGVERAAQYIEEMDAFLPAETTESDTVGDGAYSYTINKTGWRTYSISATGTVNQTSRQIKVDHVYLPTYAKFALWMAENGEIYFIGGEEFDGHVHSNDKLWFADVSGIGPIFHEEASSALDEYGGSILNTTFDKGFFLNSSQGHMSEVNFPELNSRATQYGLVLEGQTDIEFVGDSMKITNERKGWTDHVLPIGEDQLVYIKDSVSGDPSTQAAKATIEGGTLDGRISIVTENDILIQGNIYYSEDPSIIDTSDDALGLISKDDVWIHQDAPNDLHVDAAILAAGQLANNRGSFGVLDYWEGDPRGELIIYGSIVQDKRGGVGTFSSEVGSLSGYTKNYSFDTRFGDAAPPYYPVISDHVEFDGWSEGPTT